MQKVFFLYDIYFAIEYQMKVIPFRILEIMIKLFKFYYKIRYLNPFPIKITLEIVILCILAVSSRVVFSQTVSGRFVQDINQQVELSGFKGFQKYSIAAGQTDSTGYFRLHYAELYNGMAQLTWGENKTVYVVLNGEDSDFEIFSENQTESVVVNKGEMNKWFESFAHFQNQRAHTKKALLYIKNLYQQDTISLGGASFLQSIVSELKRLENEEKKLTDNLDPKSPLIWFLFLNKEVHSFPDIPQFEPDSIQSVLDKCRKIDYLNPNVFNSGLIKDFIEGQYWLADQSNQRDSVEGMMNTITDYIVFNVSEDEEKLQAISTFLFNLFTKYNLTEAAEYLSVRLSSLKKCNFSGTLKRQVEHYRFLKKGVEVPEILFDGNVYQDGIPTSLKKMSDISSDLILLVFGSAKCPYCREEFAKLQVQSEVLKNCGIKVLYISLDENEKEFLESISGLPGYSYCDFKNWETKAAKDYFITGTPTFLLIDKNRKLQIKPETVDGLILWCSSPAQKTSK